jgi:hypothetical protein
MEEGGIKRVKGKTKTKTETGNKQGDLTGKVGVDPLGRPCLAGSEGLADAIAVAYVGQAVASQHGGSKIRKFGICPRADSGTGGTDRLVVRLDPGGCRLVFSRGASGRPPGPNLLPNGKRGDRLLSRARLTGASDDPLGRRRGLVALATNSHA